MSKHLVVCALKQYHLLLVLAYTDWKAGGK